MPIFTVDETKCRKDGFCAAECPIGIIAYAKGQTPRPVEGAEKMCIRCGHCVAVCEYGALSHEAMKPEDLVAVTDAGALSAEKAKTFLRSRRSIRSYKSKEVPRETLEALLDVARYAPTGSNSQQVGWVVVASRAELDKLVGHAIDWMRHALENKNPFALSYRMDGIVKAWEGGLDIICRGAPALVCTYAPANYMAGQTDCTIALTHLDLAAPSHGLGTCWAGFFMIAAAQWPALIKALGLPEGARLGGAMMAGYPKHKFHRLPERNPARIGWIG